MRLVVVAIVLVGLVTACPKKPEVKKDHKDEADVMFSYEGKDYTKKDLPEETQVSVFQAEERMRRDVDDAVDTFLLNHYFQVEAAKQNKTPDDIQTQELNPKDPTDAELKDFYDQKKDRIPYPFETVKDEIRKVMSQDRRNLARLTLLQKIKDAGKFTSKIPQSIEPIVNIKSEGFASKGSSAAKVHVVEFADFLCPHCYEAFLELKGYWPDMQDKVDLTFMYYPLNAAEDSLNYLMAKGAYCAHKQQKFWEFHDMAFAGQRMLGAESPMKFAAELKLDKNAYAKCLSDKDTTAAISASRREAERVGVRSTPTFYVNGKKVTMERGLASLRKAIEDAK